MRPRASRGRGREAWLAVVPGTRAAGAGGARERELTEQPKGDDDARVGTAKEGSDPRAVHRPRRGWRARHRKQARGCGGPAHRRDPFAGLLVGGQGTGRRDVFWCSCAESVSLLFPSFPLFPISVSLSFQHFDGLRWWCAQRGDKWLQVIRSHVVMVSGHMVWWRTEVTCTKIKLDICTSTYPRGWDGMFHATNRGVHYFPPQPL